MLFDASQQVLLATNHTSVIKAGEKPKNKYKEAAEVDGWGEVMIDCIALAFLSQSSSHPGCWGAS